MLLKAIAESGRYESLPFFPWDPEYWSRGIAPLQNSAFERVTIKKIPINGTRKRLRREKGPRAGTCVWVLLLFNTLVTVNDHLVTILHFTNTSQRNEDHTLLHALVGLLGNHSSGSAFSLVCIRVQRILTGSCFQCQWSRWLVRELKYYYAKLLMVPSRNQTCAW